MESKKHTRFLVLCLSAVVTSLVVGSLIIPKGADVLWLNGQHTPTLDFSFYYVTSLGNGLMLVFLLVLAVFMNFRFALATVTAFAATGIVSFALKRLFHLPRPARVLDPNLIHVVYDVKMHFTNSFPSGHTMTAFCTAALFIFQLKSKAAGIVVIGLATLVGASRIYLGQHFLQDVAAGALLGSAIGLATSLLFQRARSPWLDRRFSLPLAKKQ